MVKRYRKKPVEVEAMVWTGFNVIEAGCFMGGLVTQNKQSDEIYINTLEGTMRASVGDYIIKGVKGEFYPCKPGIFEQTYEEVTPGRRVDRSLTLRELKEMKGEPVWIKFLNCKEEFHPQACLVIGVDERVVVVMTAHGISWELLKNAHGFYWVAYDHKPEVEF